MNAVVKQEDQQIVVQATAWRPPTTEPVTPMDMLSRAVDGGASIEVLERLMGLSERWEANRSRKAFDAAIAAAKAEIPPIIKNKTVDFTGKTGIRTHYKHETLAEIAKTIDPILGAHGLSYRYRTHSPVNEPITVTCIISHRDGYSEENSLIGPRDDSGNKNSIQAIGSAISYLQRYSLKAALGLSASEREDDGKATGDSGSISDDQCQALSDRLREVNADFPKFLAFFKLESLADLPASRFGEAMTTLNRKAARS